VTAIQNRDYRFDVQLREGLAVETWFYEMTQGGDRFEVKNDRRALETRNVYVETHDDPGGEGKNWKPSGIHTTEADCWIFALGDPPGCFIGISTPRLRLLIENAPSAEQRFGSCPTRGRLVPLRSLIGLT